MPTSVVMPQMGESIAEGTIVRWMKNVGDVVERDEPLFEISTDKVDAEIPSPAAGVLTDIRISEGETVAVNSVVGTITLAGEVASIPDVPIRPAGASTSSGPMPVGPPSEESTGAPGRMVARTAASDGPQRRTSPLVRRIAKEHQVNLAAIAGSGIGGRVTKHDILHHLERLPGARARMALAPGDRAEKLSVVRKKIAEHMVMSRRTSAHVHSVFHVDFSAVERLRQLKKREYEQAGSRLTYMAFIATVVAGALRRHPILNASLDGDQVVYKANVNLGVAVALDTGLIVPVVKDADQLNLLGLSRAIADLAERARSKRLNPEEVHGGTFTITNPGQFGAQFGMPIINQPQVAILGIGTIEKRPVVVEDTVVIRTMAYLTLGFDHRLIDGAIADQFMADVKARLESFDAGQV